MAADVHRDADRPRVFNDHSIRPGTTREKIMGKALPRYVQGVFGNALHERSLDHPRTRTLCGKDVFNVTRCTPEDGYKLCGNCARIRRAAAVNAAALEA